MSKINPNKKKTNKFDDFRLANGGGMLAAKQSNIQILRRVTLANLLWENNSYVDGIKVSEEIKRLVPLCNPKEVYELALECRLKQKLRHTPLFIAVEMCKYEDHKKYVGILLPQIITRADMLTDFLALYWKEGKTPLANQVKKGLAYSFYNFNEYQFAKYDRNSLIKLRDVLFLTHPKPRNKEEEKLFKKIANRTLDIPETWETMLSAGKDKNKTWTYLINEGKIGGLAMLRNISNMMKANVDRRVISKGISNIKSTMLLPLDFIKSQRMNPVFSKQIEEAMINSYSNLPKIPGKSLFIIDVSGSMNINISSKSDFSRYDAAAAMVMLAVNQCEDFELVTTAGNDFLKKGKHAWIQYPSKGFDIINQIRETNNEIGGGGIFTRQCLEYCQEKFKDDKFDRIIIFSDSQDCDYPTKRVPKPFGKYNYICDISSELRGINYKGIWTAEISGFSEHFLTYIASLEGLENMFND